MAKKKKIEIEETHIIDEALNNIAEAIKAEEEANPSAAAEEEAKEKAEEEAEALEKAASEKKAAEETEAKARQTAEYLQSDPQNEDTPATEQEATAKGKRGRKAGVKNKKTIKKQNSGSEFIEKEEEESTADVIISLVNAAVIPTGAKFLNKNIESCLITPEQEKEIIKYRPESAIFERGWFQYFSVLIGTIAVNVIKSKPQDKIQDVMNTLKSMSDEQRKEFLNIITGV